MSYAGSISGSNLSTPYGGTSTSTSTSDSMGSEVDSSTTDTGHQTSMESAAPGGFSDVTSSAAPDAQASGLTESSDLGLLAQQGVDTLRELGKVTTPQQKMAQGSFDPATAESWTVALLEHGDRSTISERQANPRQGDEAPQVGRQASETRAEVAVKNAFKAAALLKHHPVAGAPFPTGAFVKEIKSVVEKAGTNLSNDAAAQVVAKYSQKLDQLIQAGPGSHTSGQDKGDGFSNNSLGNISLPETALWGKTLQKDETFHVYDGITLIGAADDKVTLSYVRDNLLRDAFSYPGFKMGPVSNAMQGGDRLVYVTKPDVKSLSNPDTYLAPVGVIEQARVPGGVINITTETHGVYQGTVRRTAFEYKGHIFVHTHGVGINKAFDTAKTMVSKPVFEYAAEKNDQAGLLAFKTLDRQIFLAAERHRQ
jgi:hypothetical protein